MTDVSLTDGKEPAVTDAGSRLDHNILSNVEIC